MLCKRKNVFLEILGYMYAIYIQCELLYSHSLKFTTPEESISPLGF